MTTKLENGQFDLQEVFEYRGVTFTAKSWGKGSTAHSFHLVEGLLNGEMRTFRSSTRKQAKDMFKKAVRKNEKRNGDRTSE